MARILIVDDLEPNRYMLQALLTGHGHEVVSAVNGVEALEAARSRPVDLIVTDVLMPVKDGFSLCREWQSDDVLKKIPFIFYTATYTDKKDIDFGLSLGADRYLIKPMEPPDLMAAIEEVMAGPASDGASEPGPPDERDYLQEYSQALIRKLEHKMQQLEAEVRTRRRTEAQMLKFKTAIEHADEAIVLMDGDGLVQYVNSAFERTMCVSGEEILGRPISIFENRDDDADPLDDMWRTIKNGETWRGHLSKQIKAEKTIELEATVSPIPGENGGLDGYVSVIRDVTRQMALERQLGQSQKMEAIGTLAGGIAHDFNNILSAIMGYTQLAQFEERIDDKTSSRLNSVMEACDRAKHLVDQILTFCRRTERKKVLLELGPIVKESQKFLRASIPSTIDIRIDMEAKCGYILADPIQIQQVVLNLCTNAVYAMQDSGGLLEIRLRPLELDELGCRPYPGLKPGRYLLMSVSDNGCGMDRETASKIFEPFFTTKERGEGTGLGLSVALGIVQGHGGTISVYSEPGRGATFNVYFPVAEGMLDHEIQAGPIKLPAGHENILFVDDEPDLVLIGSQMLEKLGYRVTTALSGREALDEFRKNPEACDLVITDQTMRGMTGLILAAEILKINPRLPVIICTGFSTYESEEKARAIGVAHIMSKPLDFKDLALTVRDLLDDRKTEADRIL